MEVRELARFSVQAATILNKLCVCVCVCGWVGGWVGGCGRGGVETDHYVSNPV